MVNYFYNACATEANSFVTGVKLTPGYKTFSFGFESF